MSVWAGGPKDVLPKVFWGEWGVCRGGFGGLEGCYYWSLTGCGWLSDKGVGLAARRMGRGGWVWGEGGGGGEWAILAHGICSRG